jgi:hypothetical protein
MQPNPKRNTTFNIQGANHTPHKYMKHPTITLTAAVIAMGLATIGAPSVRAQDAVQQTTTTTTSAGTISQFDPQSIVVTTQDASAPVRYTYTKSTTYVDESGNPVSIETVKSGLPVTVYYTQEGNDLVASKVIVRKTTEVVPAAPVQAPPPAISVQESKTTTTTTTNGQ